MSERPFDSLRAADPAASMPPFDPASAKGQELLARAKSKQESDVQVLAKTRRRTPRLLAVAAVGLAGLAAAAAYVTTREPDRVLTVNCYGAPTLRTNIYVVSTQEKSAVDACWEMWRAGKFSPTPTPSRLVACVLDTGSVGVFPGGPETCARLRADRAPEGVRAAAELVALSDNLAVAWRGVRCMDPDRGRALGRKALDDAGLPAWPVIDSPQEPFSEAKPCATTLIDEANDRLVLVPQERRPDD